MIVSDELRTPALLPQLRKEGGGRMTFIGILDAPPEGFRRLSSLSPHGYEVWAKGSLFSKGFRYCYVRKVVGE